jgi:hypothetical protein
MKRGLQNRRSRKTPGPSLKADVTAPVEQLFRLYDDVFRKAGFHETTFPSKQPVPKLSKLGQDGSVAFPSGLPARAVTQPH